MNRHEAVEFLRTQCIFDPPLDESEAEALWRKYRARVDALPARVPRAPQETALTRNEREHAVRFRNFLASCGVRDVLDVVKLDLSALTTLQLFVTTERSQSIAQELARAGDWLSEFLPLTPRASQISYSYQRTSPMTGYVEFQLPHPEFAFEPNPHAPGNFHITECLHHATVMKGKDRTFLTTGYHRSFARVMTTPASEASTALVAVVPNTLESVAAPPADPGCATAAGDDPLGPFGAKAARIRDFFTEGLFFEANLRMRRFQLQLKATVVALDERRNKARALGKGRGARKAQASAEADAPSR